MFLNRIMEEVKKKGLSTLFMRGVINKKTLIVPIKPWQGHLTQGFNLVGLMVPAGRPHLSFQRVIYCCGQGVKTFFDFLNGASEENTKVLCLSSFSVKHVFSKAMGMP